MMKTRLTLHSLKMEPERRTSIQIQLLILLVGLLVDRIGLVSSQILRLGHCPSFSALKDFEMDQVCYFCFKFEIVNMNLILIHS